jgi:hypothetical protein
VPGRPAPEQRPFPGAGTDIGIPGLREREPVTARPGEARCGLTDLITTQCAHCTGRTGDGRAVPPGRREAPPPARGTRRPAVPHICLSCGGSISPGQAEERVPVTRGRRKGTAQYRHVRLQDCRAALAQPPGGNAALIGCYQELAAVRVVSPRHARS